MRLHYYLFNEPAAERAQLSVAGILASGEMAHWRVFWVASLEIRLEASLIALGKRTSSGRCCSSLSPSGGTGRLSSEITVIPDPGEA